MTIAAIGDDLQCPSSCNVGDGDFSDLFTNNWANVILGMCLRH